MDNNELDSYLESKFKFMQGQPQGPSLAPEIMARIADEAQADLDPDSVGAAKRHPEWVLAFAWLLGALVCAPTLGACDAQLLLQWLPAEVLGDFAPTLGALALPLLLILALLPTAWLMLED